MFWILLKIRLQAVFATTFKTTRSKKSSGSGMKILIIIAMLYLTVIFSGMLFATFTTFAKVLVGTSLEWLYFAFAFLLMIMLGFITTVFAAQSQIFEAKDNELLLSMPIPPSYIVMTRIGALMVITLVENVLIAVISIVSFYLVQPLWIPGIIIYLLSIVGVSFITLTLSSIMAWVLASITSRLRSKTLVTTVLSIGFFIGYFYMVNNASNLMNTLVNNTETIGNKLQNYLYPAYCGADAILSFNLLHWFIFLLCTLAPFALVVFIISKTFLKIALNKTGPKKRKFKDRVAKSRTPLQAFSSKELSRFFSSAPYMLNASFGLVMMIVAVFFTIFQKHTIFEMAGSMGLGDSMVGTIAILALTSLGMTNYVSASSVSLEGESLWIVKTLPVPTRTILLGKLRTHIIINLPITMVVALIFNILLNMNLYLRMMSVLLPISAILWMGLLGLITNIQFPKLDWADETTAVKQSMSVFIATMVSFAMVALVVMLYFVLANLVGLGQYYLLVVLGVFVVTSAAMYYYLCHEGARKFDNL